MKKRIKGLLFTLVFILGAVTLVACDEKTKEETPQVETGVNITVYNKEKEKIYDEKKEVSKANLFDFVSDTDDLKMVWEESEGGQFLVSVVGISYGDEYYWHCYVNDKEFYYDDMVEYHIQDQDKIEFRIEKEI